jgi:membrane protein required for colicin V production
MIFLDIIIGILLIWGAYKGYQNGFVVQSLTLIALILGVWLGVEFAQVGSLFVSNWLSVNKTLAFILAFTLIFIIVVIAAYLLGKLITRIFSKTVLGGLNRLGGLCFGIIKMAFIISIIILILQSLDTHKKSFASPKTKNAKLYTLVSKIAPAVFTRLHLVELKDRLLRL